MLFWLNELSIEKSYNDLLAITAYAAGSKYFGTAGRVRKKGIHTYTSEAAIYPRSIFM